MAKPIVDGLEKDLEGRADVARLGILSKPGREVARKYGVRSCPAFLIFDDEGTMIAQRDGLPDQEEIEALVTGTRSQ